LLVILQVSSLQASAMPPSTIPRVQLPLLPLPPLPSPFSLPLLRPLRCESQKVCPGIVCSPPLAASPTSMMKRHRATTMYVKRTPSRHVGSYRRNKPELKRSRRRESREGDTKSLDSLRTVTKMDRCEVIGYEDHLQRSLGASWWRDCDCKLLARRQILPYARSPSRETRWNFTSSRVTRRCVEICDEIFQITFTSDLGAVKNLKAHPSRPSWTFL